MILYKKETRTFFNKVRDYVPLLIEIFIKTNLFTNRLTHIWIWIERFLFKIIIASFC